MKEIGPNTKLVSLIGKSVGYSKAPDMMNAGFEALGLDCYCDAISVDPSNFDALIQDIRKKNYIGLTITTPYKLEIERHLAEKDSLAEIIGAFNCVKVMEGGRLKGYNADGEGFVRGLENDFGITVKDNVFFVIGAGGASRAISTMLATRKPKTIYITERFYDKVETLCKNINEKIWDCCVPLKMTDDLKSYIKKSSVLINATNSGMPPFQDECPIDTTFLHKDLFVADVIYNPSATKLLQAAQALGCRTVNGFNMLLQQGLIAFEIITGEKAPYDAMHKAVYGD